MKDTLRPLTEKEETIYVIAGSDAEEHVPRRFPTKTVKRVDSGIRRGTSKAFCWVEVAVPGGQVGGIECRLPFHVYREGTERRRPW